MRQFTSIDDSLPFFRAMASEVRVQILKLLIELPRMNLSELSARLNISSGALTSHIHILEEVGIIKTETIAARHGVQKICSVVNEKYLIHIGSSAARIWPGQHTYNVELCPGHYIDYEVTPTCGIATSERIVGVYDQPEYFADVERFNAQILWFTTGFVEYEIPNYLPQGSICTELVIQAELGSEAEAYNNDYKSDIHFHINGNLIGIWQSPGDFGGVKGLYSPDWWAPTLNQYGTLVEIRVSERGTFVEHSKVSDVTLQDLDIISGKRIRLRLAVPPGLDNSRGLTVYGRGFGNYNIGIVINCSYWMKTE